MKYIGSTPETHNLSDSDSPQDFPSSAKIGSGKEWRGFDSGTQISTEEVREQAKTVLIEMFKQYNPEKKDSDNGFYATAYSLNRLFCPDLLPENTGSLDENSVIGIEPVLEELEGAYPYAVLRFRNLFILKERTHNKHKYDPERSYYDEEEAFEYYINRIGFNPDEVLNFAFAAISSKYHGGLGINIGSRLANL